MRQRVVVLGAGGIGSLVAAYLARAGHNVVVVARGDHLRAMQEHGLTVRGRASFTVEVVAVEKAAGECDALIVATKTGDTEQALARVAGLQPELAFSLQNGVGTYEPLAAMFGADKVIGGGTMTGAARTAPGIVDYTLEGGTIIGELEGGFSDRTQAVVELWTAAGLTIQAVDDIRGHSWSKQALHVATAIVAVSTNLPCHLVWSTRPLAEAMVSLIREVAAVAAALGIDLSSYEGYGFDMNAVATEPWEDAIARVVARGQHLIDIGMLDVIPSMLQDIRAGRRTEIEHSGGYVVRQGERVGVRTPLLTLGTNIIRGLELANAHSRSPLDTLR